jgi:hypothetical protein
MTGPAGAVPGPAPDSTLGQYGQALLQWLIAGGAAGELDDRQLAIVDAAAQWTVSRPVDYAEGLYETVSAIRHAVAGTVRARARLASLPAPAPTLPAPTPAPASPSGPGRGPGGYRVAVERPDPVRPTPGALIAF